MSAVSNEMATKEVNYWLDFKGVRQTKREKNAEFISEMVSAFEDGIFSLDPKTKDIKFKLTCPSDTLKELTFKPRVAADHVAGYLGQVKPGDGIARICAYTAALTGESVAVIKRLDTEDLELAGFVAIFFM